MVHVPGYESDVFVSYAHVDDYRLPGDNSGWVTRLVKQFLEPFTNARLGSRGTLKLWMDHELEAGQPITPQLLNQVRQAATLVVVLSYRPATSALHGAGVSAKTSSTSSVNGAVWVFSSSSRNRSVSRTARRNFAI